MTNYILSIVAVMAVAMTSLALESTTPQQTNKHSFTQADQMEIYEQVMDGCIDN